MTGIHDAQPGDIFADENDKLWRVISRCDEPMVHVEAVEPDTLGEDRGKKQHQRGGISGLIWKGFKFLHRPAVKDTVGHAVQPNVRYHL